MNAEKLILGTVQFGISYGVNNRSGKPSKDTVFEILGSAHDFGIKTLDTAEVYGNAHALIGQFHKLNPNKKFNVITKLPADFNGDLQGKINKYLDEFGLQSLEALLFHSFESYKSKRSSIITNDKIVKRNIKFIGVSVYTNEEFKYVINDQFIDIIQIPFNLFDNFSLRGELIAEAKQKGKIVHTRSAFLQGLFFAGQINSITASLQHELGLIKDISRELNISIGTLALSYCLQQSLIDNVLFGVETTEQLEQNLKSLKAKIPQRYIEQINAINIENYDLINPSKW